MNSIKKPLNIYHQALLLLPFMLLLLTGCKKLVEVGSPLTATNAPVVYSKDITATAVLTSFYSKISQRGPAEEGHMLSLSLYPGLSADEWTPYSGITDAERLLIYNAYYRNALSIHTPGYDYWYRLYEYIFPCNAAIEGLHQSTTLTPSIKQQLTGEAKFMRALFYFYLVNLYGDVPLALTTDYAVNSTLPRSPKEKVYQQIIADLQEAQSLLTDGYVAGDAQSFTEERVRPNKWTATALLARTYLYTVDFPKAEEQAGAVIHHADLYNLDALNDVFLKNSHEAIWQLQPVNRFWNTEDARKFVLPATGPSNEWPVYLSEHLLNSFEPGDQRKINWVNNGTVTGTTYHYPYKYKSATYGADVTEYTTVFRLGEQYLIRAEARAQQENLPGATADLNAIRKRAGLPATTAATQSTLLTAILHERQVELFTEWGHRWLDLKRTNTIDAVMSVVTPQKGGTWNTNWQLYPIPQLDLERNPSLTGHQNAGY